jgi:hypothetical protein
VPQIAHCTHLREKAVTANVESKALVRHRPRQTPDLRVTFDDG